MGKEKFEAYARDLLPVIEKMIDVVKDHNIVGLPSITVNITGYFTTNDETGWNIVRMDDNSETRIHNKDFSVYEVFDDGIHTRQL